MNATTADKLSERAVWTARAADLAEWSLSQVNRDEVWGGYLSLALRGKRVGVDGREPASWTAGRPHFGFSEAASEIAITTPSSAASSGRTSLPLPADRTPPATRPAVFTSLHAPARRKASAAA
jgi:hypothetical protein